MTIDRRTILGGIAASPVALAAPPFLRNASAQVKLWTLPPFIRSQVPSRMSARS
jgi:hypothetical protein